MKSVGLNTMYQELVSLAPTQHAPSNRRSRTRKDILRAALVLIEMEKSLTVQAIANQSGVSKPTIYRYYNSPDEIERDAFLSEVAAERAVTIFNSASQALKDVPDIRERAHSLAEAMPQLIESNGAFLRSLMVQHYRQSSQRPEWLASLIQQVTDRVLEPVRRQLTVQDYRQLSALLATYVTPDGHLVMGDRAKSYGVNANESVRLAIDLLLDRFLGPDPRRDALPLKASASPMQS